MLAIAAFTGQWPLGRLNQYNSYSLQAKAWLEGRLDLGTDYEWLELAIYQGKYYVSFPPFPSYLLLPFVAIFGVQTPDSMLALLVALIGIWHCCGLCRTMGLSTGSTVFWTLFLYLANGWLFISVNGYVWFIAQNLSWTLAMAALYHARKGRGTAALAAWACSVGCRPMQALYLPVLLVMLYRTERQRDTVSTPLLLVARRWYWALLPAAIGGSFMWLNMARFGNPLEFGHNYLPEFTRISTGQFHPSYFLPNLLRLVTLPSIQSTDGRLSWPIVNGTAFYLVNPIFLTATAVCACHMISTGPDRRDRVIGILNTLLTLLYICIICCHRTLGGWHFGNRYLLDVMPWIFWGMIRRKQAVKSAMYYTLPYFAFGAAVNFIGTVAAYNHWI